MKGVVQFCKFTLVAVMVLQAERVPASPQQAAPPELSPPAVPPEELPAGSQALARGPVHEAFAKPVSLEPQAPVLVPRQPPANLAEIPPAEKPDGEGIVWVPGYWAWDADRNDFIWVSGCWRNAPPSTYWVPGHWLQADNGWEWLSGFWKPITALPRQEIEYLPAPPSAFELEPTEEPPQADQAWVPGCWYWVQDQYVRRHGYWMPQHEGWTWVPAHYVWTPRGYLFCPGYWDHDLDNRGVLFTPAYFTPEARVLTGFVFCPSICVDLEMLRLNLFCYPRYRHYYFGDYYDDGYLRFGIYPWFHCQTTHAWYDPLFVYDRWHRRWSEPHWAENQAREFESRRANRDLRPARTVTDLQAQIAHLPPNRRPERPLVQSVKSFASSQNTPIKFERLGTAERQELAVKAADVRTLREQRNRWESQSVQPAPHDTVSAKHPVEREAWRVSEPAANAPSVRPTQRPAAEPRQPESVRTQPIRVTRPEREYIPNPPRTANPFESRYIPKEPPGHPSEERSRMEPVSGHGLPGRDSPRGNRQ